MIRATIISTLVCAVIACGDAPHYVDFDGGADDGGGDDDGGVDAAVIDAPDAAPPEPGEWGLPAFVLNINSVTDELMPSASTNHLELYFVRSNDIYVTTRAAVGDNWGLPTKVDALAQTSSTELSPELSPNGLELYVVINNLIHRSTRATTASAWGAPLLLAANSGLSPALTGDGLSMYYVAGGYTIMKKTRATLTSAWGEPESVSIPGDPAYSSVSVSPNDLRLLLSFSVEGDLPQIIELTRASTLEPWGNLAEAATLTALSPAPRDCDFFADEDTMYCAWKDDPDSDFNVYVVQRTP